MSASEDRLAIRVAGIDDADALAAFFASVWGAEASGATVTADWERQAAANPVTPGRPWPCVIAIRSGRVLGYLGTIPATFWNGGEVPGYWAKGLMVLPEFRGGPIGYHLAKELSRDAAVRGAVVVAEPARRLFTALGYRDLGTIPNLARVLRPGRVLAAGYGQGDGRLRAVMGALQRWHLAAAAGWSAGIAFDLLQGTADLVRTGGVGSGPDVQAAEIDGLWTRVRTHIRAGVGRHGRDVLERLGPNGAERRYHLSASRRHGRLQGYAVTRLAGPPSDDPRLLGLRIAVLADLLYDPPDTAAGHAAVAGAEAAARASGADVLIASPSAAPVARLLRGRGFLTAPATMHLLWRGAEVWPSDVTEWWLHRGDSDADAGF